MTDGYETLFQISLALQQHVIVELTTVLGMKKAEQTGRNPNSSKSSFMEKGHCFIHVFTKYRKCPGS